MKISLSEANIIDELYVRTADENYITARWCSIHRLHTDFAWSGVHALEKYLKAILLYNGESVIGHSHDIVSLYELIKPFVAGLLPNLLTKPPRLGIGHWFDRTAENFLAHLYENGNADNRYLIYGYDTRTEDVHMLDTMVFAVRRLICRLDDAIFNPGAMPLKSRIPTYREMLLRNPRYQPNQFMPLDDRIHSKLDDASRHAALNLNFEFAPNDYLHTDVRSGDSSRTPVLRQRILDPLSRQEVAEVHEGIKTTRWLLENVRLPKEVRKQIQDALKDAERRVKGTP